jgi:hypothetical protein
MPIRFFCPECDARVLAPVDAAGDYVDCRRCGTEVRVPNPRGRHVDSDEDDRPRSRRRRDRGRDDRGARSGKRRGKQKKSKLPLILALVGAGVVGLLILGAGIAIYRSAWSEPAGTKTIVGETWYPMDEKSSMFSAYFPDDTPVYDKVAVKPPALLGNRVGDPEDMSWSMQTWISYHRRREYSVFLFKMPTDGRNPDFMAHAIAMSGQRPTDGSRVLSDEQVTVDGHPGRRIVTRGDGQSRAAMSFALGTRHVLVIYVMGKDNFDHTDPMVAAFFDNLTIH